MHDTDKAPHRVRVLGAGRVARVAGAPRDRIAAVARLQHGCLTRHQLNAIAVTDDMIETLLARGTLTRVYRGVYVTGLAPMEAVPWSREAAALLAVPKAVALSHRTAARLWELDVDPLDPTLHVVSPHASAYTGHRGVRTHRSRILTARDVRIRHGLPVTSPARTLLDEAQRRGEAALEVAYDDLVTRRLLRPTELAELLRRAPGHRGTGVLRALLDRETTPALTRSAGERRLLTLLREAGLPAPLVNVPMQGFIVDFYWPDHTLVVELDGLAFHSTRRAIERDRRKDQVLRAAGLPPLRITGSQLAHHPVQVVAIIAGALAS